METTRKSGKRLIKEKVFHIIYRPEQELFKTTNSNFKFACPLRIPRSSRYSYSNTGRSLRSVRKWWWRFIKIGQVCIMMIKYNQNMKTVTTIQFKLAHKFHPSNIQSIYFFQINPNNYALLLIFWNTNKFPNKLKWLF